MKLTQEVDATLQELKAYPSSVPTLVAPKPKKPKLLYLVATNQVVSAALGAQLEVEETDSETNPTRPGMDQDGEEQGSGDSSKIMNNLSHQCDKPGMIWLLDY